MRKRLVSVLVFLCLAAMFAPAQEFRATISGRVLDASGGAVPNAKLQAVNVANNETSNATTDSAGTYTIPFLRPGQYKLTVTAAGFKQYNRENLTLEVGRVLGIDVVLEVGAVTESINVTAESAALETQTASRVATISTTQVAEMPLNSRNPYILGSMMSGVTFRGAAIWQRPFDNGAIAEWSVNGGRQSNNEFLMDGAPNNGQAGGNNIAYVPIVDAVQEFSVQQNSYDAQYGKTGGGVFNVVLKSGTNQFHATGWEFMRRRPLDANTFQSNSTGGKRPDHTLDQYGFQVEGPVYLPKLLKKDGTVKLFYLGSFENYREKWPQFLQNSYPEPEMRTGDFSKLVQGNGQPITIYNPFNATTDANGNPVRTPFAGNMIPASMINPVAKAVTAYMPAPNARTAGVNYSNTNNLNREYAAKDKFYNLILKFDWNFGDKHRAFFRHASNDRTEDRAVNNIDNKPGTNGQQPFQRINDAYVADWVSTLSPTLILNVRASYNRFIETGRGQANTGFDLTSLGLPSSLVSRLPSPTYFGEWTFDGYSTLGRYQGINITNNYGIMSNVTKILGAHTMKFGGDIRRIHFIQQNSGSILYFRATRNWTQRLFNQGEANAGDSYASFLLGLQNDAAYSNYPLYPFFQQWYFAPYFQDDWKVSRKLTVNVGLRWDYNGAASEKYNRINRGFDSAAASPIVSQIPASMLALYPQISTLKGGFRFAGANGVPRLASNNDLNNWQPRFGAAYQINSKLVMRGGWGIYSMNPNNDYLQTAGFATTTPMVVSNDGNRTPVANVLSNPYPSSVNTPTGSSLGAATFVGRNNNWFNGEKFRTPYVHQFSYGFQYQMSSTSTLDLSYVGSRTIGANDQRNFNIPSLDFRKKCNLQEGGSPVFCDSQVTNPFRSLPAFAGTAFYTANTVSQYQINRPFPQFNGDLLEQGRNTSKIWYNSLQINYNRRMGRNLTLMANYTWSKMLERWGYNDAFANVNQQGLYFNDRAHIFKFNTVYQLPFGQGQKWGNSGNGFASRLISGWQFTTYYNNSSGEPNDLPGNVIMLKDPRTPGGGWDGSTDWKAHQVRGWNPCVLRQQNDGSIAPQAYSIAKGCGADPSNYVWLQTAGYAPRYTPSRSGQIRKHHAFTMDASLNKMTNVTERLRVQFRLEAFNLLNHNFYGRNNGFITNPDDANFGSMFPNQASDQNGYPRQIQIGIKAYW
ncbi:MAG: TonB-dependent receptor [Candidatus Solibacter usitatus]|nr:TonB-dependent receptor [Candidatus Solibacter usitatus]